MTETKTTIEALQECKNFTLIVAHVRKNPFQTQKDIAQALGLSENTVSKHCRLARKLEVSG